MKVYFYLLITALVVLASCNEEITVGDSIIEDSTITVEYTDTAEVAVKTMIDDSVVVYQLNNSYRTFLLGEFNDPDFGSSKADLYLSTRLLNTPFPLFDTLKVDSVVLFIQLDTLGQFGNENAVHNITVYQLQEELEADENNSFFAFDEFNFNSNPIGETSLTLKHRDSLDIYLPIGDTITKIAPQLRVKLDTSLWSEIARDSMLTQNDTLYKDKVKGFLLRSQPSDNSFAGLNLSNDGLVGIEFYFSNLENTQDSVYLFDLGFLKSNNFTHDYSGTSVGNTLDIETSDNVYLQAMKGLNIEVDLANVVDYADRIINKATLTMYLLDESNPILPPAESVSVFYKDENGSTTEILESSLPNIPIDFLDGGLKEIVISGQTLKKYDINLTNHVIDIIRGNKTNTKVSIEVENKSSRANRSIILGTGHPDFPMKLNMITSKP